MTPATEWITDRPHMARRKNNRAGTLGRRQPGRSSSTRIVRALRQFVEQALDSLTDAFAGLVVAAGDGRTQLGHALGADIG